MKNNIILYEPGQLEALDKLLVDWSADGDLPDLLSLDAEIDYLLDKKGLRYISAKDFQNRKSPEAYMRSDSITREMFDNEKLSFLTYKDVSLLKPLRLTVHVYFIIFLHYLELVALFVDTHHIEGRLVVLAPTTALYPTSGFLAEHELFTVVEAVRRVAESRHLLFEVAGSPSASLRLSNKIETSLFMGKRAFFGLALSLLNFCISLRSRRPIRVLASDYWRNIAPILKELPEAELFLLDRSEALKAGIANLWKQKIRLVHIRHFLSWREKRAAIHLGREHLAQWIRIQPNALNEHVLMFCGVSLKPLCERIMTRLMERAVPSIMCDIAGTYAMYERLMPTAVLLRASVSGQTHFAILPLVARAKHIPALEVQHGGEYLGPGSPTVDHPAYFFAAYGDLVCNELRALGYAPERLLSVGSPRFDSYALTAKNASPKAHIGGLTILTNTPTMNVGERFGTYSVEEYFKLLGDAVRAIPEARLRIASRSNSVRAAFLEEAKARALSGVQYESVGTTPLPTLFQEADIFVCSHSTVVYEALLYRLPVVVASFAPVENMMSNFHFARFSEAGALRIANTPQELSNILAELARDPEARARMSTAGEVFMEREFSFDGKASTRLAKWIRQRSRTN